jgi:hypothetical protein
MFALPQPSAIWHFERHGSVTIRNWVHRMNCMMYFMYFVYMWKTEKYMGQLYERNGSMYFMYFSRGFFASGRANFRCIPTTAPADPAMTYKAWRATLFEDRARIGDWQVKLSFREERTRGEPRPGLRSAAREVVPGRHLPNRTAPTSHRTKKHSPHSWPHHPVSICD